MITLVPSSSVESGYSVNWNYQQNHVLEGLKSLLELDSGLLTDVTFACDGEYVNAHKVILSLCSPFFKDLFTKNKADKLNTIIILGNVSAVNLRYLLQFIYQGKVDIPSQDVDGFLEAGKTLKIEGLTKNAADHKQTNNPGRETSTQGESIVNANRHHNTHSAPSSSSSATLKTPAAEGTSRAPAKKSRLAEPVVFQETRHVPSTSAILRQSLTSGTEGDHGVVTDPFDAFARYEYENEDLDGEEGIDFSMVKTEPIQVYSGFAETHHSETIHSESIGEDSYSGSIDEESYPVPMIHASAGPVGSQSVSHQLPNTSRNTQPRGSAVPVENPQQLYQTMETDLEYFIHCFRFNPGLQHLGSLGHGKTRNVIWRYFDKLENVVPKCSRCRLCFRDIKVYGGHTSDLKKHLKSNHKEQYEEFINEQTMGK